MDKDELKIKHLEFIQNIISRMASNSFYIKGWAITLVVGILALSSTEKTQYNAFVTILPTMVFWGLDAYYLRKERLFRSLYDRVRKKDNDKDSFSMSTDDEKKHIESWLKTTISSPLASLYFTIIVMTLIYLNYFK